MSGADHQKEILIAALNSQPGPLIIRNSSSAPNQDHLFNFWCAGEIREFHAATTGASRWMAASDIINLDNGDVIYRLTSWYLYTFVQSGDVTFWIAQHNNAAA